MKPEHCIDVYNRLLRGERSAVETYDNALEKYGSEIAANAAFTQGGYKGPQNSPRLSRDQLVARRIEELQARNERKAEWPQ